MYIRKPPNEMTLKDDFMFSAVMMKPENCKPMLERILGINIGSVTVDREKSIVFNPDYRGIRIYISCMKVSVRSNTVGKWERVICCLQNF